MSAETAASLPNDRSNALPSAPVTPLGVVACGWGLVGVAVLLSQAMVRLAPFAVDSLRRGLTPVQWLVWAAWMAVMLFFEGYRGFQHGFSPRVVVRALYLARAPKPLHAALAPFFCMGLFHATRRRMITSWSLVLMVVGLVAAVRHLEQPWRGIIDAGVVAGLLWGLSAVVVFAARSAFGRPPDRSADLPANE